MKKETIIDILVFLIFLLLFFSFPWLVKDTAFDNVLAWTFFLVVPTAVFLGLRKKKIGGKL